jgi:predicted GTPase
MDYQQAERASSALADIVESIAELIEGELGLSSPAERLRQRAREIRADRFSVLVVGEFKRGKSTLLNAMMGGPVLPQKVAPCTAVVTIIAYGEHKRVSVRFAAAPGKEPPADESLSIEEFQRRYALESADAAADEGLEGGFDRFSAVDHARIEYPVDLCRHRVELVDSPGLGEHRVRTERTQAYLDRADAVVMVLDATQLLRLEELHFLENILLPRGLKNIFFVVNKWNLIADGD